MESGKTSELTNVVFGHLFAQSTTQSPSCHHCISFVGIGEPYCAYATAEIQAPSRVLAVPLNVIQFSSYAHDQLAVHDPSTRGTI